MTTNVTINRGDRKRSQRGADIAFDVWTLTDYFASRPLALLVFLIANFVAKVKAAFAMPKLAFAPAYA